LTNHAYGSADLYGYDSTDDVYLDNSMTTGVTAFPWCAIVKASGMVSINYLCLLILG
jgi:hypothetical protein